MSTQREYPSNQAQSLSTRPNPSQKPISQLQRTNPRDFQLNQVAKRFSPLRNETPDGTVLTFALAPSDPDFPFDLQGGLHCTLTVPVIYPQNEERPTLRVTNAEMPRGFQINVEKGFTSLVERASAQKTLLALLNDLDKNLEQFLTAEKAQTIKIIANVDRKPKIETSDPGILAESLPKPPLEPAPLAPIVQSWTAQQKSDALAKRQVDIRQLVARMGRLPNFSRASDDTIFNVPVQIANLGRLPLNLQPLKEVTLMVPKLYNLEPCTVLLKGVYGPEVENVQLAFERYVREKRDMSLMAYVNYLTQNIHTMATEIVVHKEVSSLAETQEQQTATEQPEVTSSSQELKAEVADPERPHVKFISRPPEWDRHDSDDASSESSYDSEESTGSEENEDDHGVDEAEDSGGAALPASAMSTSPERGIHISFPNLELHGIELLTIASLSLSVKCLRCKSPLDVANIRPNSEAPGSTTTTTTRTETCSKCTTPFTFSFTATALHSNTIRAGTVEVTGCTVTDFLPSLFQPTCSSCSTTFPSPPGVTGARGDTTPIQVCRACHAKMTFSIPEVKFLRVTPYHHDRDSLPLRQPKKKEDLGISVGSALPSNGTCVHYRHSYRWFRFSCCGRVYACDRCHDAAESHVNEHADRMVCGWCSREQRFRAEDCGMCGRSVMRRRKVGGFWEGGMGTRDRRLMRRGERRKYKKASGKEAAAAGVKK